MDADRPASHRMSNLLGWFGLGLDSPAPAAADHPVARAVDPLVAESLRLGGEIGAFLARYRLPPTHLSLAAALDCVSGNDPRLVARLGERQAAGEPVTPEWLAEIRRPASPEDEVRQMNRLMDRFEGSITDFGRTTLEARTATSEYSSALRDHVDDLHAVDRTGEVLGELVGLARTMLERTAHIERQIARSEQETRALHRSLDEARRDAEIDHLTGLPNRRAFEGRLDREVVAARTTGEPLCVAFCDIDRFKRINDTHGHDAGDRVLKVVAHALNELSDDRCHVARHGGEEFVVLLRGQTLDQAYALLDEAREHLAERRMVNRATEQPFGKVSFSAGIADVLAFAEPREALKAADEALYVAKAEGRNRIVRAPARLTSGASPKAA